MFGFLFRKKDKSGKLSSSESLRKKSAHDDNDVLPSAEVDPDVPRGHGEVKGHASGHNTTLVPEGSSSGDEEFSNARSTVSLCGIPEAAENTLEVIDPCDKFKKEADECERSLTSDPGDLQVALADKTEEIEALKLEITMLSTEKQNKTMEVGALRSQLGELQEANEISATGKRKVERQLEEQRLKNSELMHELGEKEEKLKVQETEARSTGRQLLELNQRLCDLEGQISALKREKVELVSEHEAIEVEREEEMGALKNGLERALEQSARLQKKAESDFCAMRNSFAAQEQQLMDDFEWKLHQVEANCKAKLRDKDRDAEQALKEGRSLFEREMLNEKEKVKEERRAVEDQMRLVCHYKAYEAELVQLRGLTHEQQRALRSAARQLEHFKFNEKIHHDELRAAKKCAEKEKSCAHALQLTTQRKMDAKEEAMRRQLDQQRTDLNSEWEERLAEKCARLQETFVEEKRLLTKEVQSCRETISSLQAKISEVESSAQRQLEIVRESAEAEKMELQLGFERTAASTADFVNSMKQTHAQEVDSLQTKLEECQKTVSELEQKLSEQLRREGLKIAVSDSLPVPTSSPINQSDSGCCDEGSSEESEYELGEVDEEGVGNAPREEVIDPTEVNDPVVYLREEVASLQGSIEKLTTNLVCDEKASSESESEDDEESE